MPLDPDDRAPIELPLQLRALNALGPACGRLGIFTIREDPGYYLQWARRCTGLQDFGPYDLQPPLERLLSMLKHEADLSLFGRIGSLQLLRRNLVNNLRLQEAFSSRPELATVDVESPIIILCTLRTGSTLLHNLMALHPDVRSPKLWELHRPCPPPRPADELTDPRIRQSDREFGLFYRLVPAMRAIHYFAPEAVEECTHLFLNLLSCRISFASLANGNSYTDWIMQQDMANAYRAYKRYLQVLTLHYPGRLLVLKSPLHLLQLDALTEVFPGARIVHLHRDPATAAGSFCSLTEAIQIAMRNRIDTPAIGRVWQELWAPAMGESIRWRQGGSLDVVDVNYADLVEDPVAVVEGIFRHFGEAAPPVLRSRIARYLQHHPKDEFGIHRYSLARYGLNRSALYGMHRDYIDYFGVPRDNPQAG